MLPKYEHGEPPEWKDAIGRLEVRVRAANGRRSYEIVGPCPRCGHDLRKDVTHVLAPALALSPAFEPITVRVECNCTSAHDDAPAGALGCGAWGGVELTP